MAPPNLYLFGSHKIYLCGQSLWSLDDVKSGLADWERCIQALLGRCEKSLILMVVIADYVIQLKKKVKKWEITE